MTTPLVGRDAELGHLRDALARAADGAGGCLVVDGSAGIGKSRLLAEVAADAKRFDVNVAAGRAAELDRVAPLASLLGVLRGYSPGLAQGAVAGSESSGLLRIDKLRVAIEDHVRSRRLVVLVDDSHWADELTALALRVLVPALTLSPVLWVLARRPAPVPGAPEATQAAIDWLIDNGATHVQLEPLADEAMTLLATHLLDAEPDPTVMELISRGEGNPFLLEQLLTSLRTAGRLCTVDGRATVVDADLPVNFFDAVNREMRSLPTEVRRLLDAGSVLARPFTLHEAAGLLQCGAVELAPAATNAVASGALIDQGDELVFHHDLVREAVYGALPGPVRCALHREAATVVRAEGRSTVEAADHLVRGGRPGDQDAKELLRDAVAQVSPTAPATAADLTLRMLELVDLHDPERPGLVADAVRLLATAGRVEKAVEIGDQALRSGLDAPNEAILLLGLAEALKHAGRSSAVVEYTGRALGRAGVPEPIRAQLLAIRAHGMLDAADLTVVDRVGAEAIDVGTASGQLDATVFGMVARSVAARACGALEDAVRYARDAVHTADTAGGEAAQRHPRLWLARALTSVDQFAEADAAYEMGQREADHMGTAWSQPLWHYYRAELRMAAGRVDDAFAEAEAGVRVSEQLGARALTIPTLGILAQVGIMRDEVTAANDYLGKAHQLLAEGVGVGPEDLAWREALVHDAMGRPAAAVETLADIYAGFPDRVLILSQDPLAGAHLVRVAQRAGAEAQAIATVTAAKRLAELNPTVPSLVGSAAHAEGVLHDDPATLRCAVQAYRSSPQVLARATALEDLAQAECITGNRQVGADLLWEALDLFQTCGAKRDATRATTRLRRIGGRRASVLDAPVTDPWETLTESELRVVRLVADGMTNREAADHLFLSPHTVDSHLRHSFVKLGVNNRVELTRQAIAHRDNEA